MKHKPDMLAAHRNSSQYLIKKTTNSASLQKKESQQIFSGVCFDCHSLRLVVKAFLPLARKA